MVASNPSTSSQALVESVVPAPADTTQGAATPPFPSTVLPGRNERRLAFLVVLISTAVFIITVPFARQALSPMWAFIPFYQAALAVSDVVTATLLVVQFMILRTRRLLALTCAYIFTAAMVIAHTLSFPGLFTPTGLLGAGPQSTAWLYMFWHAGFPLLVIAYALLSDEDGRAGPANLHRTISGVSA